MGVCSDINRRKNKSEKSTESSNQISKAKIETSLSKPLSSLHASMESNSKEKNVLKKQVLISKYIIYFNFII